MTQYTVSQGETSTVTLHGGDFLNILSGGTAVSTIANGGTITVNAGGLEQNGTLNSGASEYVDNGGAVSNTTVSGGTLTVSGGGLVVFSGGVAVGLIVEPTATTVSPEVVIQAGGTASNTTLIGTVDSGGGYMSVSGGTSIHTIIGNESIESDGMGTVNSGAVVQKGGDLEIGDNVHPSQSAGAFGFNISVGSGGGVNAWAGTLLSGTIVNGGSLGLQGVGTRAVDTVLSNGTEVGGTTTGTIVNNGGFQEVNGNFGDVNVASGTIVNSGGTLDIEGTGTFVGEVVNAGGTVRVGFAATLNGYAVAAQTTLLVTSLGHASGAVVGGTEVVSSGGVTSDTVISGGTLNPLSGAVVVGVINFAGTGGTLDLVGGALPSNVIGFLPGNEIDIAGLTANSASYSSSGTSGTLTLFENTTSVGTLTMSTTGPAQFSVVADGHGGTLLSMSPGSPPPPPPPPMTPAGTTADLILQETTGANTGQLEVFNLGSNGILAADVLGNLGLSCRPWGLALSPATPMNPTCWCATATPATSITSIFKAARSPPPVRWAASGSTGRRSASAISAATPTRPT